MFGSLRPNKGLEVFAEVTRILGSADVRFVIAGRGHDDLEQQARDLQQRDPRVTAEIGFISLERKAQFFQNASVIALPYTSFSSQSAVLHDAYGYGRPVVVTDVGALGATVREDSTGLVTAPGDAEAFAQAIAGLLEPSAWARASMACARVAMERSPQEFGRGLRSVYEQVLL